MAKSAKPPRQLWLLTAVGRDQPGIVAPVTKLLFELGANLEDSAMTRLGGEFAILLMFSAPTDVSQERLAETFSPLGASLGLSIHLRRLPRTAVTLRRKGRPYQICVYGADRSGIVYHISEALAKQRINITDVSTHRTAPTGARGAPPLYLMLLEVELPSRVDAEALQGRLRTLAKRLGVEVTIRSAETLVF